jgi:hypothetical protein
VAIEIWTMDDGYFFDNVAVTNSPEEAAALRASTWAPRHEVEAAAKAAAEKAAAAEADKASTADKGSTTLDAIKGKARYACLPACPGGSAAPCVLHCVLPAGVRCLLGCSHVLLPGELPLCAAALRGGVQREAAADSELPLALGARALHVLCPHD